MSENRMTSRLNTRSGAMMIDFGIGQKPHRDQETGISLLIS
jgi:hypothetical protein